jgi:hypothetical protein
MLTRTEIFKSTVSLKRSAKVSWSSAMPRAASSRREKRKLSLESPNLAVSKRTSMAEFDPLPNITPKKFAKSRLFNLNFKLLNKFKLRGTVASVPHSVPRRTALPVPRGVWPAEKELHSLVRDIRAHDPGVRDCDGYDADDDVLTM